MTKPATTSTHTYTWTRSQDGCAADVHATHPTCVNCEDPTTCAGCGAVIPAGATYLYCSDNGETACNRECATRAEAVWGDDNW